MNSFRITLEWLEHQEAMARGVSRANIPGEEYRALLAAARTGMGYPLSRVAALDYMPADNPNWRKYQQEQRDEPKPPHGWPRHLRLVDK